MAEPEKADFSPKKPIKKEKPIFSSKIQTESKEKDCYSPKKTIEKEVLTPKVFITYSKSGKRRKNRKIELSKDSITKSSLFPIEQMLGITDLYGGKTTHFSFDIPLGMRKAFVRELKDNGDSGCQFLTKQVCTYIVISKLRKQSLGDTLSRIVDIDFAIQNLNFQQNVQSRPRRYIRNTEAVTEDKCGFHDCFSKAVAKGVWRKQKEFLLCEVHLNQAKKDSLNWQGLETLNIVK